MSGHCDDTNVTYKVGHYTDGLQLKSLGFKRLVAKLKEIT